MNKHNLLLASHTANEYGGWVKIVKRFRLFHRPMGLSSVESVTIINNFAFKFIQ